ncbi:hypothetical protein Gocc_2885 [Gaiella occulta]|uniref:Sigma-70, region 4 n=1 Tax=Gaiella occulta TaxID=1002870 RepID=A0A7M2YTD1_9ACTN|nr:sigma-70 family RNA polymerase sigma factor [Gaiella occulta]RDI73285.1 hypothetical protein Gocc_2885 [Gaiella occulta]
MSVRPACGLHARAWELLPPLTALDLPDRQREAWFDHRVLGMTQDEIAGRDGVTRQAVSQWVIQVDGRLAALLGLHEMRRAA